MEDYIFLRELGISYTDYILKKYSLSNTDKRKYKEYLSGVPISKLTNRKEFYGKEFITSYDTLDPREDSESIINLIKEELDISKRYRFLELGVGTGCLIISILNIFRSSYGLGVDISKKALRISRINYRYLLGKRLTLKESNWWSNIKGNYDILISNPPYLRNKEIKGNLVYDPYIALNGGKEGIECYIEIEKEINRVKLAYLEIDPSIIDRLEEIFKNYRRSYYKDEKGNYRILKIECQKQELHP